MTGEKSAQTMEKSSNFLDTRMLELEFLQLDFQTPQKYGKEIKEDFVSFRKKNFVSVQPDFNNRQQNFEKLFPSIRKTDEGKQVNQNPGHSHLSEF